MVLDQVAQVRIPFVTDRGFERQGFFGNLSGLTDVFERHVELFGKLLRRRFSANLVE
jgi:hypothetical protein